MLKSDVNPKFAGLLCATLISMQSMAQTAPVPDHPRENEVNQRLDNQQAEDGTSDEGLVER